MLAAWNDRRGALVSLFTFYLFLAGCSGGPALPDTVARDGAILPDTLKQLLDQGVGEAGVPGAVRPSACQAEVSGFWPVA